MFVEPNNVALTADAVERSAATAISLKPTWPRKASQQRQRRVAESFEDPEWDVGHHPDADQEVDDDDYGTLP